MVDIDKLDLILKSVDDIKDTLKTMNDRQRTTEQSVTEHGIEIVHLMARPTGVKAMSIIAVLFTLANGALAFYMNGGDP